MALWLVYSMVVAGVLVVVAVQRERVLAGLGRPVRHVWLVCMLLTVVLTASVLWTTAAASSAPDGRDRARADRGGRAGSVAGGWWRTNWMERVEGSVMVGAVRPLDGVLVAGWLVSSALFLTVLAMSVQRLRVRRAGWRRAWVEGEPVLLTDGAGPAVVGLVRGEIVLPEWVLTLEREQQSLIIEHERQHRIAGDPLLMGAGLALVALLPWNPFMWLMVRRMRRAMEIDCDRRVMRDVAVPAIYAKLLVEIGSRAVHDPHPATALTDSLSDLEHRVARIIDPVRHRRWRAGARTVLGGALLLAACFAPRPALRQASGGAPVHGSQPSDVADAADDTAATAETGDGAGRGGSGSDVRVGAMARGGRGRTVADSVRTGALPRRVDLRVMRPVNADTAGGGRAMGRGNGGRGGTGAAVGARGRTRRTARDTLPATGSSR